jgi:hypothetical protein
LSNSTQRAFGSTIKRARPARWQAVAVWAIWVVSVVFVVISLLTVRSGGDLLGAVGQGLVAIPFATVGTILVNRLPGNVIGWLLAAGCWRVLLRGRQRGHGSGRRWPDRAPGQHP